MSELFEENKQEREPFVVDNDQKAEWVLEQIRHKNEELEKWKTHYEAMFEAVRKTIQSDIVWFEGCLKGYFLQQDSEGLTKAAKTQRSYQLPSGKLVLKQQQPEFSLDEAKVIEWLRKNGPDFIKVKESVDWAGLKKTLTVNGDGMVTEDGEVVPGVTVTERPEAFKVEVK